MGIGGPDRTAFEFTGSWQAFLPIALTNSLLTVVTLGIYRFWATTRERKYFWSQTRFIDDQLEWTGTGLELFIGFVVAFFAIGIPFFILNFIAQGAILQGVPLVAGILGLALYIAIFWLIGFAIYRGLRYRLSRTSWHGIHGGTDSPGFSYGTSYLWKTVVGTLPLGLGIPWASINLFKERWEAMSFGPHRFTSNPDWKKLMKRFALFYILPVLIAILAVAGFAKGGGSIDETAPALGGIFILFFIFFYIALPLISLIYYAAYSREVVGSLGLGGLEFGFTARSTDWLILMLGNIGLYLLAGFVGFIGAMTFGGLGAVMMGGPDLLASDMAAGAGIAGIGVATFLAFIIPFMLLGPFIRYRSWAFFMRYMEAGGEVNLANLTQSETKPLSQGEGLLDAFDVGAI
jgi:uncharacterized membrane protein YjgN (DUF898 family)